MVLNAQTDRQTDGRPEGPKTCDIQQHLYMSHRHLWPRKESSKHLMVTISGDPILWPVQLFFPTTFVKETYLPAFEASCTPKSIIFLGERPIIAPFRRGSSSSWRRIG